MQNKPPSAIDLKITQAKVERESHVREEILNRKLVVNGKDVPLSSSVFEEPIKDETVQSLKSQYAECTKTNNYRYTMIGAVVAVPAALLLRTYWTLFLFTVGGSFADFYKTYSACSTPRKNLDEYMLVRRKVQLEVQKELLKTELQVLEEVAQQRQNEAAPRKE